MELNRRGFITGLGALIAAPAIIRVADLMPIKAWKEPDGAWWEISDDHDWLVEEFNRHQELEEALTKSTIEAMMADINAFMRQQVKPLAAFRQFR